jgi:hypothetical protein
LNSCHDRVTAHLFWRKGEHPNTNCSQNLLALSIRPSIRSTSVGFLGLNLRHGRRPALRQGRIQGSAYPKPIDFLGDTAIQPSPPGVSLAGFPPRIAAPAVPESKHPNDNGPGTLRCPAQGPVCLRRSRRG